MFCAHDDEDDDDDGDDDDDDIVGVCLGNIYPGAPSQLGGSGKWVITVSGCSPPPSPVLVCCAANTYSSVGTQSISSGLM